MWSSFDEGCGSGAAATAGLRPGRRQRRRTGSSRWSGSSGRGGRRWRHDLKRDALLRGRSGGRRTGSNNTLPPAPRRRRRPHHAVRVERPSRSRVDRLDGAGGVVVAAVEEKYSNGSIRQIVLRRYAHEALLEKRQHAERPLLVGKHLLGGRTPGVGGRSRLVELLCRVFRRLGPEPVAAGVHAFDARETLGPQMAESRTA